MQFGGGAKEESGDGGTMELMKGAQLIFWSVDTSTCATVLLQTRCAAEAEPHTQQPLHLHHHLARKSLHSL
jgi:hypothetical protein